MYDPSFIALALIISEKMTLTQKLDISQWTIKSRSRLKIEHTVDHYSSRCMHDPSFMALALIVSEKMTYTQKLDICQWTVKIRSSLKIEIGLTLTLQDVCMTQVSWL